MHANDAKTFLKHFSDCLFYFCSTCADSITGYTFNSVNFSPDHHLLHLRRSPFPSHASTTVKNLLIGEHFPHQLPYQLCAFNSRLLTTAGVERSRDKDAGVGNEFHFHLLLTYIKRHTKPRFPLAELTGRVLWPLTRAINSGSGNRALSYWTSNRPVKWQAQHAVLAAKLRTYDSTLVLFTSANEVLQVLWSLAFCLRVCLCILSQKVTDRFE